MPSGVYLRTDECKKKISEGKKGKMPKNIEFIKNYWKGKKRPDMIGNTRAKGLIKSEKWREVVKKANKNNNYASINIGEKHWRWKLDRSQLVKRQERNDSAYYDWRKRVWLRDNFKCKINNCDCSGKIIAHHILGWALYPELRYEINNGITLCHAHHPKRRAEEKRLIPILSELVSVSK